ncbi:hypothetical protein [Mesomycoplasma ovipneumoniae]|uniref:hypothetical protein n=1 Tax=Mesomycoplasma ovipneumoniae TaxID=29562 RepID=UPI002964C768|nr:hypothetical protein [Mesomycoplasma ovipneumoniae]MDW2861064.1 hypothetical protein [Mesomycoplasma ovipneumoniae]
MLHLIYKKLKKNKVLLLSTSFLALPTLLISCIHPYQEFQKQISKSLVPPQGSYNPKTANPEKGSPILEENSEIISNSVLGFNGQKKNPKEAKNRFDVAKNYTEEIVDASFLSGKYGLLPYWYYLQSIPKYLENKGYGTRQYNKEEYLKRLDYFYGKIREYFNRNLVDYKAGVDQRGEVQVWRQGLQNDWRKRLKLKEGENFNLPEDLSDEDKVDVGKINVNDFFSIIKPELDRYNAQIPNDTKTKYLIVFDFLLANERIWPSSLDKYLLGEEDDLDQARLFRDDYYIEKNYKPSEPEKLWYELGWFMLRVQRIISSANAAESVLENIHHIEKQLFELTDQNKDIGNQIASEISAVKNFTSSLARFLKHKHHLNLRKDLVFNIDISNNQDDQSLISDFIDYYNQKIAPIIWRNNLNTTNNKIKSLTKLLKDDQESNYFNTYLKPFLPEIKDLKSEEDIKNDPTIPEDKKDEAKQGVKKAGIKAWGNWLKTFKDKYGIQFKPSDDGIDSEDFDHESSSSVVRPDRVQNISSNNAQQTTEQTQESQEPVEAQSQN